MTELTPQEAADKAAVAAMRGAQSNMEKVLKRVSTLEGELRSAQAVIKNASMYVGENAHTYPINGNSQSVKTFLANAVARIEAVL